MASDCIRKCALDPESGRCLGCNRTIEEITRKGLEKVKARHGKTL